MIKKRGKIMDKTVMDSKTIGTIKGQGVLTIGKKEKIRKESSRRRDQRFMTKGGFQEAVVETSLLGLKDLVMVVDFKNHDESF